MDALAEVSTRRFDLASQSVLDYLKSAVPMAFWSVTRYDGVAQVYLTTRDDYFGLETGDGVPWVDSFCQHTVSGRTPEISPDAMSVPLYADSPAAKALAIGAYVGVPIRHTDGTLFGTLCGIDPARQSADFEAHDALLHLLTGLLSHVLDADLALTVAARAIEHAELRAETDALTGLLNRRGWDRFIQLEDERIRRYGDACSVLILDLDGLKTINDTEGHAAGDECIRRAAAIIKATTRSSDVGARLGGDEFGVIATATTEDAAAVLQERLESEFAAAGISASIGRAALSIKTGLTIACAHADAAMYASKADRRLKIAS